MNLNPRQIEAVTSTNDRIFVVAAPGAGKTAVLIQRIIYLIANGYAKPHEILAVTFTNKAAKEMRERLSKALPNEAKLVTLSTFHSFGARMLREEMGFLAPHLQDILFSNNNLSFIPKNARQVKLSNRYSIYSDNEQDSLIYKVVVNDLNLDKDLHKAAQYKDFISNQKNLGTVPEQIETEPFTKAKESYIAYQARLMAQNGLDFDDLILYPYLLFKHFPERLKPYTDRFKYILIDEFQDTNGVQFELAQQISQQGHLFVVGDPDQGIYSFRHADFRNVQNLMDLYPNHHLILLEQNYRSGKMIISAANRLIVNNKERVDKLLWTDNNYQGETLVIPCYNELDESAQITDIIRSNVRNGVLLKNMAVLMRTNAQARAIESEFVRCNIPYNLLKGTSFYGRMEIMDTIAYLKVIFNGDIMSFKRMANIPVRKLGDDSLEKITAQLSGDVLEQLSQWADGFLGLQVPNRSSQSLMNVTKILRELRNDVVNNSTITDIIGKIITVITPHLEKQKNTQERLENVRELLTVSARLENPRGLEGLQEFLDTVSLVSMADDISGNNKVVLGTIHAAKGLEWDLVIVSGSENGLCPHFNSSSRSEIEEERRLFYVAVTRAKRQLFLTYTESRTMYGSLKMSGKSPFLQEMGL